MATTTRGAFPYPIGTDAPPNVHLDIKALADRAAAAGAIFLQGVIASRPAVATANQGTLYWSTDTTRLYYSTGSAWLDIAAAEPLYYPSFPTSPVQGQRASLFAAGGIDGDGFTAWQFVYDASPSSASKWRFTGGAPALSEDLTTYTFTANSALNYGGSVPGIAVPFAGYYEVDFGAVIQHATAEASLLGISVNGTTTWSEDQRSYASVFPISVQSKLFAHIAAVGDTIRVGVGALAGSGTVTVTRRWLAIRPIRVTP